MDMNVREWPAFVKATAWQAVKNCAGHLPNAAMSPIVGNGLILGSQRNWQIGNMIGKITA